MAEIKEEKKEYRLPRWMKAPFPKGKDYSRVKNLVHEHKLNTICVSGNCPNKGECWNAGTASFMIMGNKCTRNCRFCDVINQIPSPLDWDEPIRLAETIKKLKLKHCVITSVTRDDLIDGGAEFWATTIKSIKKANPEITIETLIPDFMGNQAHLQLIFDAKPEVISHNLETVRRITPKIRSHSRYERSLKVLEYISESGIISKSGIMLGLGEKEDEVIETLRDLRHVNCKVVTIGQYLQPSPHHARVEKFVEPEMFKLYEKIGYEMGFNYVESSPLVRSSYHAERHVNAR
ncbi:lipoyl synthase [Bacteroidota bacterium]